MTFIISGWEEGLDKVGLNVLLREYAGLSLGAAKKAVDEILDDKSVYFDIPAEPAAREFLRRAEALGCTVAISLDRRESSEDDEVKPRGQLRLHG